jgi:hypothetical protein
MEGRPGSLRLATPPLLSYLVCIQAGRNARAAAGLDVLAGLDIATMACAALSIALCLSGVILALYWPLSRAVRLGEG